MELGPILRAMQRNKLRFGLIAAQIAVTLAIVVNCVTLILDARRKMSRPPTFNEDNLISIQLRTIDPALLDQERRDVWHHDIMARLREIPGVRVVSASSLIPWSDWSIPTWVKPVDSDAVSVKAANIHVDENLPEALGVEVDEGRWFTREEVEDAKKRWRALRKTERERTSEGKVREPILYDIVVSRALGEGVFGEGPLLGKMLEDENGDRCRIIGVLRGYSAPAQRRHHEGYAVFWAADSYWNWGTPLLIRTEPGKAAAVLPMIEERTNTGEMLLGSKEVHLVTDMRKRYFGPQQMAAVLMGLLIFLLLFVASLGIAGLTSFSVTERTRQIGTRRALGATTGDILRYFLTESGLITTMGLLFGAGLAVLLNIALLKVYDGAKLNAGIVLSSALLLWAVGLGAALPPALRGARTSPAIATRNV